MALILDLSRQDEARLSAAARQRGVDPAALARQIVTDHLPPLLGEPVELDSENLAAIALLQSWLKDEATDDPTVIREAEQELEEFKRNLNANRADTGERLLFP